MGGELQKAILGRPHNIPELVFVKMAELSQDENNCPPYHSYTNCEYWIKKHGVCPYCILGSKPAHESVVDKLNGHGKNVVVKQVEVVII